MNDAKITKAIINEREELVCNILVKPWDFTEEEITMLRAGKTDWYTYSFNIVWYQTGDEEKQLKEKRKELNFKMGYCFLATNNLQLAKARFLPLINDAKYGNDSRYYFGFISYKLEDYGIAESTLKEIADDESYRAEITYYLLDISFKAGKFKRCIKVGLELYPTIERKLKSDVAKIIGESYFNLNKYAESIPYLKAYKGTKGKWNNTDFYQLGYAYYKQNDFENAVNNFNKIIDQKNSVSQNAYYHLGECYMKLENKSAALNAFKSASLMVWYQPVLVLKTSNSFIVKYPSLFSNSVIGIHSPTTKRSASPSLYISPTATPEPL